MANKTPIRVARIDIEAIEIGEKAYLRGDSAGIEHMQTDQAYQCLKLITRPGCERTVPYAFEYARAYSRKKVTCFTKDNIMKFTEGKSNWTKGSADELGHALEKLAGNDLRFLMVSSRGVKFYPGGFKNTRSQGE